jgi:hypothetical protein
MDKKTAGLIGAVAGLAAMGTAHAAIHPAPNPTEALQAASYSDLLAPVQNAVMLLQADDAARAQRPPVEQRGDIKRVDDHHHHHHHHHHQEARRNDHHHHHHHHHDGTYVGVPGLGVVIR